DWGRTTILDGGRSRFPRRSAHGNCETPLLRMSRQRQTADRPRTVLGVTPPQLRPPSSGWPDIASGALTLSRAATRLLPHDGPNRRGSLTDRNIHAARVRMQDSQWIAG